MMKGGDNQGGCVFREHFMQTRGFSPQCKGSNGLHIKQAIRHKKNLLKAVAVSRSYMCHAGHPRI